MVQVVRNGVDRPAISTGPALMIPAGYPRDLPSALLRAARDFGTSGVVEIGPDGRETRLDFPILLELAARILAGLRANGVRAGDPAVVYCTEPVGFFAAFWACTLGGIRPLLMPPAAGGDTTEEGRERLRQVTDLLGWTVLIGRPADLPNDLGLPVLDPDALAGHEPTSEFHRPAADDVAVLMMSSGSSTGTPKIIQLTHRGLVEFAAGTPAMLPVRPGQTTLNWLPLDHSGAFLLYHLLPVFTGCTNIHVATDWVLEDPLRWLDLMDQHRVNHSWSPNFGYRLAAAAIAGEPDRHWDLSALRSLVSGGEQITVPVVSEFLRLTNRFGVVPETFVAAWGMTETVTGITFARPGLTPNVHRVRIPPTGVVEWVDQRSTAGKVAVARPGKSRVDAAGVLSLVSVGTPAPGATVRIVGSNGAVLPEGRIGQLQIASARVTPGYLGNPDADLAAFPEGNWPARKWLSTGDQAFITGGQVVITGRDSDRIILNGQNYYAHDIEAVAASVEGVELGLVAACGIADAAAGTERLVLFYALTEESPAGVDEAIRTVLHDRLVLPAKAVGVPRRQFPITPGGKILRPLLKQRWIDGTLESPTHPQSTPPQATPAQPGHPQPGPRPPAVSPYGEPVRPGAFEGQERATADSAQTGYEVAGPDDRGPEGRAGSEEDPSEQTTELPVVRLAWRRALTDSIPHPPERPAFGANRDPASAPAPNGEPPADLLAGDPEPPHPTDPADLPTDPANGAAAEAVPADLATDAPNEAAAEPVAADPAGETADLGAGGAESIDPSVEAESAESPEQEESADLLAVPPTPPAIPETDTVKPKAWPGSFPALVFDQIVFDEASFPSAPRTDAQPDSAAAPTDDLPPAEEPAPATSATAEPKAIESVVEAAHPDVAADADTAEEAEPRETEPVEANPDANRDPSDADPVVAEAAQDNAADAEADVESETEATEPDDARSAESAAVEVAQPAEVEPTPEPQAESVPDNDAEPADAVHAEPASEKNDPESADAVDADVASEKNDAELAAENDAEPTEADQTGAEPSEAEPTEAEPTEVQAFETGSGEAAGSGVEATEPERAMVLSPGVVPAEAAPAVGGSAGAGEAFAVGNHLHEPAAEFRPEKTRAPEKARANGKKKQAVEPIAIIGLAARFPGADTLEQFWDNLLGGVESIRRFSTEELGATKDAFGNDDLVAVGGALDEVESFDAAFFGLSAREAELTDPAQRLFLEVCQHALEHGGYAGASGRIGIFAGSGMNLYTQQNQPPDFLATRVAYRLGLTGPAIGVQAAWSSSLVAVHL
ncbi:MAG TPA: beta-ketoacyl synthase N-terminal-like domain-containing protein, partial [Kribbella sp.]